VAEDGLLQGVFNEQCQCTIVSLVRCYSPFPSSSFVTPFAACCTVRVPDWLATTLCACGVEVIHPIPYFSWNVCRCQEPRQRFISSSRSGRGCKYTVFRTSGRPHPWMMLSTPAMPHVMAVLLGPSPDATDIAEASQYQSAHAKLVEILCWAGQPDRKGAMDWCFPQGGFALFSLVNRPYMSMACAKH